MIAFKVQSSYVTSMVLATKLTYTKSRDSQLYCRVPCSPHHAQAAHRCRRRSILPPPRFALLPGEHVSAYVHAVSPNFSIFACCLLIVMCSMMSHTHYFCVIIIQHAAEYGTRYEPLASENYGNYCWILVDYSSGELAAWLTLAHKPHII